MFVWRSEVNAPLKKKTYINILPQYFFLLGICLSHVNRQARDSIIISRIPIYTSDKCSKEIKHYIHISIPSYRWYGTFGTDASFPKVSFHWILSVLVIGLYIRRRVWNSYRPQQEELSVRIWKNEHYYIMICFSSLINFFSSSPFFNYQITGRSTLISFKTCLKSHHKTVIWFTNWIEKCCMEFFD